MGSPHDPLPWSFTRITSTAHPVVSRSYIGDVPRVLRHDRSRGLHLRCTSSRPFPPFKASSLIWATGLLLTRGADWAYAASPPPRSFSQIAPTVRLIAPLSTAHLRSSHGAIANLPLQIGPMPRSRSGGLQPRLGLCHGHQCGLQLRRISSCPAICRSLPFQLLGVLFLYQRTQDSKLQWKMGARNHVQLDCLHSAKCVWIR